MKKSTKLASLVLAAVVALNGLALPTFAAVPFLETQTGIISKQVNYTPGVTVTKPTAEDLEGEYGAAYADAGFKVTFTFCSNDASIQSVSVGTRIERQPDTLHTPTPRRKNGIHHQRECQSV